MGASESTEAGAPFSKKEKFARAGKALALVTYKEFVAGWWRWTTSAAWEGEKEAFIVAGLSAAAATAVVGSPEAAPWCARTEVKVVFAH